MLRDPHRCRRCENGCVSESLSTPGWTDIASWYDQLLMAGSGPHETALACTLRLVDDVRDLRLLDIACGQGLASRALAEAGAAEVVGVDTSAEMLALARGHGGPSTLRYIRDDAQVLACFDDESFGGVNCQLGLMDIPDLPATLTAVHRVLRPGGWFTFMISHPCFLAPAAETIRSEDGRLGRWVSDYFTERFWRSSNPHGVRRAGNHHRTLTTYLNALIEHGLTIQRAEEPRASDLLASQQPEYAAVPIFLAIRAVKEAGA
jgi:ubiquinone/menaquinone biosynthesis C-methylase UbiE